MRAQDDPGSAMAKHASSSSATAESAEPVAERLPSLDECRRMEQALLSQLACLDEAVSAAHARIGADVHRAGADEASFLQASATVIVSIAAGLIEAVSERTGEQGLKKPFMEAAGEAALLAERKRRRRDGDADRQVSPGARRPPEK